MNSLIMAKINHGMVWKKWCQMFCNYNRTYTRTAATMRYTKCFMQIKMADISSYHCRAGQSYLCIHIGTVHIYLSPVLMNDVAYLLNIFLKNAVSGRICYHQSGQVIPILLDFLLQIFDIYIPFESRIYYNYFHPCRSEEHTSEL